MNEYQNKFQKMTQNTAVIDFMNKCLINLAPDFGCITISKIMIVLTLVAIISLMMIIIYNYVRKTQNEVRKR